MLRFDLNVSLTLRDTPPLERFDHAARLGFGAVEFWWPAGEDLRALARRVRDAGLAVALINFDGGDLARGERGVLNHPQRQAEFRANVPVALELAAHLGCTRLHALVGRWLPDVPREAQLELVRENLRLATEAAAPAGVTVVVEALNAWETPGYIVTDTPSALALIESVGAPNLRYLYDIYHMQRMEGNIVATLAAVAPQIGHIQVADSPHRGQPGSGELRFGYIFEAIAAGSYTGFVGLEYIPRGTVEESLAWLPADRRGPIAPADLRL
jgi:hydroxypyruvate isomerase